MRAVVAGAFVSLVLVLGSCTSPDTVDDAVVSAAYETPTDPESLADLVVATEDADLSDQQRDLLVAVVAEQLRVVAAVVDAGDAQAAFPRQVFVGYVAELVVDEERLAAVEQALAAWAAEAYAPLGSLTAADDGPVPTRAEQQAADLEVRPVVDAVIDGIRRAHDDDAAGESIRRLVVLMRVELARALRADAGLPEPEDGEYWDIVLAAEFPAGDPTLGGFRSKGLGDPDAPWPP